MELIERIEQLERQARALRPELHFPSTAALEQRLRWLEIVFEEMRSTDSHSVYAETPSGEKLRQILAHTVYIKQDRITLHSLTADPASCVAGDEWFRSDLGKAKLAVDSVVANAKALLREGDVAATNLLFYGDGSDGDVTISSTTTLTRDMYYNNLTVNSSQTLNTNGYRIFVKGILTNNGYIQNNGSNGVPGNLTGGSPGYGGAAGTLGGGGTGGYQFGYWDDTPCYTSPGGGGGGIVLIVARAIINNGTIRANGGNAGNVTTSQEHSGNGSSGTNMTSSFGGAGGAGGSSGSYTGGSGGTVTAPTAAQGGIRALPFAILLRDGTTQFTGGAGGGGGGAYDGYYASGGGGGGGGVVVIVYGSATWGTEQALAGSGGSGWNGGGTGSGGAPGTVIKIQVA